MNASPNAPTAIITERPFKSITKFRIVATMMILRGQKPPVPPASGKGANKINVMPVQLKLSIRTSIMRFDTWRLISRRITCWNMYMLKDGFPKLRGIWVRSDVKLCYHGYEDDVIKMEEVLSFAVVEDWNSFSGF
ncbi:hypothetical protein CDAR_623411 [Caerostris darwini]|uniref:Uncharacterized protein n=1 Tax=Caerostris darwini TaxID=1538125 RepID=A0AAV4SNJ8_9ARAC|nr:hypothetical protein CDAR_623411 [Caerostris darwini]